jgi:hypothetical protein
MIEAHAKQDLPMHAIAIIVFVSLSLAACSFENRSTSYECPTGNECESGRVCSQGWCVVADAVDIDAAPGQPDGLPPDAFVCPADCSSCQGNTCIITCDGVDACPEVVVCPAGVACRVSCGGSNSCSGGVDCSLGSACNIECSGPGSCPLLTTCGDGVCNLSCDGLDSCGGGLDCSNSCQCDSSCPNGGTCNDHACPGANPCTKADGCSSNSGACKLC